MESKSFVQEEAGKTEMEMSRLEFKRCYAEKAWHQEQGERKRWQELEHSMIKDCFLNATDIFDLMHGIQHT